MNLRRRAPADLQSAPFGHLGTSPFEPWTPVGLAPPAGGRRWLRSFPGRPGLLTVELAKGIEPPTCCLQGSRSTPELRQQATKLHPMYHCRTCQPISWPRACADRVPWPPAAGAAPRTRGPPPPPPRSSDPTRPARGSAPGGRRSGHQRPEPPPLAPQDQREGLRRSAAQGASGVPPPRPRLRRSSSPLASAARGPAPGSHPSHRQILEGPRRRPHDMGVRPAAWCRGTSTPWTPSASAVRSRLPTFPGILDLVQGQKQGRLPRATGHRQQVLELRVLPGPPGPRPLVMAAPRQRRQGRPGRPAEPHPPAAPGPGCPRGGPAPRPRPAPPRSGGPGSGAPPGPGAARPGSGRGRRSALPLPLRPGRGVFRAPRPARPAQPAGRPPAPSRAAAAPRPAPSPGLSM